MKLRHEIAYDASVEQVYAMLADPAFRERSCDAMGVLDRTIEVVPDGAGMSVRIDQVQPTQGLPSFAKTFTGETTRAIQVEEWTDHTRAAMTVTTPGRPAEIRGTLTLTEDGGRTVEVFEGELKVRIPLIGGRIEGLMADVFRRGMDNEHTAGVAWLAGGR